jgi:hypothetical protein
MISSSNRYFLTSKLVFTISYCDKCESESAVDVMYHRIYFRENDSSQYYVVTIDYFVLSDKPIFNKAPVWSRNVQKFEENLALLWCKLQPIIVVGETAYDVISISKLWNVRCGHEFSYYRWLKK